jgi:vancomycin permeability regulator SanA
VRPWLHLAVSAISRGGALFLGLFVLIGLVGELRGRQTDIELWFVDLRDLPAIVRLGCLAPFAALLVIWATTRRPATIVIRATAISCLVIAALAVRDTVRFLALAPDTGVRASMPVPLSAVIAALLVSLAVVVVRSRGGWRRGDDEAGPGVRAIVAVAVAALGWALVFPVAQMAFFGTTDYRRPADAAVVFGARVYANGVPSPLLADRLAAGVQLYRDGLIPTLVVSGGTGADGWNEAEVMADVAVAGQVDRTAVVVDRVGVTTEATVANTVAWLAVRYPGIDPRNLRVIAVSQAYHLPRIQLAFAAAGVDVLTVPAPDPIPISEMPLLVAREIPAFWAYYVRQSLG